jgi:hypothetical protein
MPKVIKQIKERHRVDLECNGIKYELWAIDDTEHTKLWRDNCIHISYTSKFCSQLVISQYRKEGEYLNLAELFTVLEWLFGESSISYDFMKGSFCFHILLVIHRENGTFFYILDIFDTRGYMHLDLYKVVEDTAIHEYDNDQPYPHLNVEFSQEEIDYFFHYFYGFLLGYFQAAKRVMLLEVRLEEKAGFCGTVISRKNFLRTVISELILYGYRNGEYFEEEYKTEKIYREQIKLFEKTCGVPLYETDVSHVLQAITGIQVK